MGIVSVNELKDRTGQINIKNERKYQRTFLVEMSDPDDGAWLAMAAPGVNLGDAYVTPTESDLLAFVIDVQSNCVSEDGKQWHTTVDYGPWPDTDPNPLNQPIDVSWSFQQFERPTDRDINNKPIVNSAGDPFQEPVMRDDSRPVLTITRNESFFNASLAWLYRDAVNATPFFGAPIGTVKVSNISSQLQHDQTYGSYWKTTYEFHFNADRWDKVILDQGFRELDAGKLKNITVQGVPVTEPVLLNGAGKKLPTGAPAQFRKFRVYPMLPFTAFNF